MSEIKDMLNYYFNLDEEPEMTKWEQVYDKVGGDIFDVGKLFGDEMPAPPVKEFDARLLTLPELIEEKHFREHTPDEVKQIDKSIDILTDRIRGEVPNYQGQTADPEYESAVLNFQTYLDKGKGK